MALDCDVNLVVGSKSASLTSTPQGSKLPASWPRRDFRSPAPPRIGWVPIRPAGGRRRLTVRFTYRDDVIRIFGAGYWRKGKEIYEREHSIHGRTARTAEDRS